MGKSPRPTKPKLKTRTSREFSTDTMENVADVGSWGYQTTANMHPPAEHLVRMCVLATAGPAIHYAVSNGSMRFSDCLSSIAC